MAWANGGSGGSFAGAGKMMTDAIADAGNALVRAQLSSVNKNLAAQQASAERAMRHAAEEAEKNRQWQEMMANTQYQRAMADMKKAGLNPILAYQQGGNAVPSGSSAGGYTINGAQGQISGWQAAMMAAPELFGIVERIATSGFQRARNSKEFGQVSGIVNKIQSYIKETINDINHSPKYNKHIDTIAGAQK